MRVKLPTKSDNSLVQFSREEICLGSETLLAMETSALALACVLISLLELNFLAWLVS